MAFDGSDIGIFVLTYNRAELLPATMRSLLGQSVRGALITVLDNASTDNTQSVVKPFLGADVRYENASTNLGWAGNLARAQNSACRAWTLVFHDDDLLHPKYLEYALAAINSIPSLGLVVSTMSFEAAPEDVDWPLSAPQTVLCPHAADLAALLYAGAPIHFGSAIYRTDAFKKLKWESDRYGKIADRPFLLAAAAGYSTQVFRSPLVRYRVHAQQDSSSADSGPFVPQLAALHHCYRTHLGENPLASLGRCFLGNNYRSICDEFVCLCKADKLQFTSLRDYQVFVMKQSGCSRLSLASGHMLCEWHWLWSGVFASFHAMIQILRGRKAKR